VLRAVPIFSAVTENNKTRAIVAMSGGVDSSTAAALLVEAGYEVIGVTLKLWPNDCRSPADDLFKCCGTKAAADARAVCDRLGIPHQLIDVTVEFRRQVVHYFAEQYKAGRTPNPCVLCNERLKFGTLIDHAQQLGAEYVATGHYARVEPAPSDGRTLLKRGRDLRRDQSYFLFSLRQDQLARARMPLGELTKAQTRQIARDRALRTAEKAQSMEICFVPDNDYAGFLQQEGLASWHEGEIVDRHGHVLGCHSGIEFFTIGQRKGLRISNPTPLYVLELDPANNRVIVGENAALERDELVVEGCNWIAFDQPPATFEALAKIRYNHAPTPATITLMPAGAACVKLHQPQRAITPGQACVFYRDDIVLGGGWIKH
jgi:tRNA-specific 2-thiouridylase